MRVVGTAGHVDHGKSTLVKRLTGIDPDRLAEEQARQMTIDLGFAWLNLPDGDTVGIVDVPGHRDFIDNMLAGVGGIDAVLLAIAADEGVMPQTREHLTILDLLGVQSGLVALTKIDAIDDPAWLDLVQQDIRVILARTTLADADILPVSAHTGVGIEALVARLTALLADLPPHLDLNAPRLAIDRVFTMIGFGTVVTGTLVGGTLRVGGEIEIQPGGLRGRIRGLQSYKRAVEIAQPGSRVAINLSSIDKSELSRGQVVSRPGLIQPTTLIDVYFRHLPDAGRPLKHDAEVKLFTGTAQTTARVRLLDAEMLAPSAEAWLQLRLDQPLALAQGDRFILRYPSPGETIGGGVLVDPHPARRWKRFQPQVIEALQTRLLGTPAERLAQAATGLEPVKRAQMQKQVSYPADVFEQAVREAVEQGLLLPFPDDTFLSAVSWAQIQAKILGILDAYHRAEPLRLGMAREELRSRVGLKNATLSLYLEMLPDIIAGGNLLRLTTHAVRFTDAQTKRIRDLIAAMDAAPYTPPSYQEAAQIVGEDVLQTLIELGDIRQVQPDVIFTRAAYDELVATTLALIDADGSVTAAALRDRFGTTRKYAIGLLEHLDALGITKRVGDVRVRGKS